MINDVNTLDIPDFDDLDGYQDPINVDPDPVDPAKDEPSGDNNDDFDLTKELLTLQGITDMNKIKFEDESGAVIEKAWDSLSNSEKLMILSHQEDPDTSLDAAEIELINQIRESGMTPIQYIQSLNEPQQPVQVYEVDSMSDDELFCIDLLDRLGADNITDEELQQALDKAKENESLFSKQVASLRVYYKDLEEKKMLQEHMAQQQQREHEYNTFAASVVNAIKNFNSFQDTPVELTHDEMEDLANYILTRDDSGYTEFGKVFSDPMQVTKAAFWMLKGSEILDEMQKQIKEAYLRGYNETHKKPSTRVFTKSPAEPSSKNSNKESQQAWFDEDSYLND